MAKRVLSVGQCVPDTAAITEFLRRCDPGVEVDTAKLPADAFEKLGATVYDLVLINRKLDEDYSDGIEIIKQMKARPATREIAVMLVTNYEEHQDAAVAEGALLGFGKLQYGEDATVERVRAALR